jgi:hypothetical protein
VELVMLQYCHLCLVLHKVLQAYAASIILAKLRVIF